MLAVLLFRYRLVSRTAVSSALSLCICRMSSSDRTPPIEMPERYVCSSRTSCAHTLCRRASQTQASRQWHHAEGDHLCLRRKRREALICLLLCWWWIGRMYNAEWDISTCQLIANANELTWGMIKSSFMNSKLSGGVPFNSGNSALAFSRNSYMVLPFFTLTINSVPLYNHEPEVLSLPWLQLSFPYRPKSWKSARSPELR